MRKVSAAILSLLACAACAPTRAASSALPAPAQSECAAGNASKGEGKFTGQISGGPTGTMIEVTSGKDSLVVVYNDSVLICEGGQLASARALALGATVVAYGRFEKKGKSPQMIATKILVAGAPESGLRNGSPMGVNDEAVARGGSDNSGAGSPQPSGSSGARDDWNSGASGSSNSQSSGASQGSGSVAGQDDWQSQSDSTGGVRGRSNGQNSTTISCGALLFSITSHEDPSGKMRGRPSTSGITCRMPVGQQAMQLTQDALDGRHTSAVKLDSQNQLEAMLNDVEISSVQFTTDGGSQVVDVTFIAQKVEITHLPSGARITF